MIKMYNVEVLSKFPVVQHFHFGGLFKWQRDPAAPAAQPRLSHQAEAAGGVIPPGGTKAPWALPQGTGLPTQTGIPTTLGGSLAPRPREMNSGPTTERASPAAAPGPTVAPWSRQRPASSGQMPKVAESAKET
jgi:serine/threonine-protein phosphatase 2A activator